MKPTTNESANTTSAIAPAISAVRMLRLARRRSTSARFYQIGWGPPPRPSIGSGVSDYDVIVLGGGPAGAKVPPPAPV